MVCQVIAGDNIQRVARKHGVSRPFLFMPGREKALDTLKANIKTGETGT